MSSTGRIARVISSSASPKPSRSRSANFVRLSNLRKLRDCEQVGAVCYRLRKDRTGNDRIGKDQIEFLLIQTRRSRRWTFPKGNAEPGLTHAQAAALEAFEEAGVHGRIEEASFTQYVCRRSADLNAADEDGPASAIARKINVHLCEVKRLAAPQEANRNRTWFSHREARERLRRDRSRAEGMALARVIDRAVARIQQLQRGSNRTPKMWETKNDSPETLLLNPGRRDPLSHVRFEAGDVFAGLSAQTRKLHPSASSPTRVVSRPVLQAEILPFNPLPSDARERKRPKALMPGKSR